MKRYERGAQLEGGLRRVFDGDWPVASGERERAEDAAGAGRPLVRVDVGADRVQRPRLWSALSSSDGVAAGVFAGRA